MKQWYSEESNQQVKASIQEFKLKNRKKMVEVRATNLFMNAFSSKLALKTTSVSYEIVAYSLGDCFKG